MYTGPVRTEPEFPMFDGSTECSREQYLEYEDKRRKFRAERRRCEMRRHRPGFAKIDDMRYREG